MKKARIFLISLFVLIGIGMSINIHLNTGQNNQSINVKNIEVLAQGESNGGLKCYYAGTVACPGDTDIKVKYVLNRTLE